MTTWNYDPTDDHAEHLRTLRASADAASQERQEREALARFAGVTYDDDEPHRHVWSSLTDRAGYRLCLGDGCWAVCAPDGEVIDD